MAAAPRSTALRRPWAAFRRHQLHAAYEQRRERYEVLAEQRGLVYREADSIAEVRHRLAARGHVPAARAVGDVHTFAFVPDIGWHRHLLPDLRQLGPVTRFDYVADGFRAEEFYPRHRSAVARRTEMNARVLPALKAAHLERPVDWVFVYASGLEISKDTVRAITEELGIPTVCMCLDDKQSWTGPRIGTDRLGQVELAPVFDLSWTSARVACEWYLVEGGRPIYMPEGFDSTAFGPQAVPKDIPVSFIGGGYGYRVDVIEHLRRNHVDVRVFGKGWPGASWADDAVAVINRSIINLGMGGIGYSETLTNVKARDFEIPGTGGGMYLTSFNSDLALHFRVGHEIACYATRDELVELIRYYLAHREEAAVMAQCARARCLAEHRWLHRYLHLCVALGVLDAHEAEHARTHAREALA